MERRRRALGLKKLSEIKEDKVKKQSSASLKKSEMEKISITKQGNIKEEKVKNQSSATLKKTEIEENNRKEIKETHMHSAEFARSLLSTPKGKTESSSLKTESPTGSPLFSPGMLPVFPRALGSPEIEVSWDWGCSQVPKEMLRPRRTKPAIQPEPSLLVTSTYSICPRLPMERHMSEEENQERLTFYKNVLTKSLKSVPEEKVSDSENNNLDKDSDREVVTIANTPQRPSRPSVISEYKQLQTSNVFDDSANELMLVCSQEIEEKLKTGEIAEASVISVDISNQKHEHSPILEPENSNKRFCHGRSKLNLFPENSRDLPIESNVQRRPKEKQKLSLKSPHGKLPTRIMPFEGSEQPNATNSTEINNDEDLLLMPTQPNASLSIEKSLAVSEICRSSTNKKDNSDKIVPTTNDLKELNINVQRNSVKDYERSHFGGNYDNGSIIRKPLQVKQRLPNNDSMIHGVNSSLAAKNKFSHPIQGGNINKGSIVQNNIPICKTNTELPNQQISSKYGVNKFKFSNSRAKQSDEINRRYNGKSEWENTSSNDIKGEITRVPDIVSLLDDDLDMELSSLDVDTLCSNNQPKESQTQFVHESASRICSQQEIEAKRLAALNRLMMKKKR